MYALALQMANRRWLWLTIPQYLKSFDGIEDLFADLEI